MRYIAILLATAGLLAGVGLSAYAAPAISASPSSGPPGTSVSVSGSGFSANETGITVTFDGTPLASGIIANSAGAWSGSFTVPSAASGTHFIGAFGSSTSPASVPTLQFTVSAILNISASSGPAGSILNVSGAGYASGESGIIVTLGGSPVTSSLTADSRGSWATSFTIPPSPAGTHTIVANAPITPGRSATFTVTAAITISQGSGATGTSVTVTGSGFGASESGITVTFDATQVAAGITASAQGSWTSTFAVPASAAGAHNVRAAGPTTTSARDMTFTVLATVSISRTSGPPGSQVTISGSGFGLAESGITVTYDGAPIATGISAGSTGSWTTSITIPPAVAGPHTIHVYGSATPASSTSDIVFMVAAGASLDRTSGSPGSSVSISGAGFNANETGISIVYDGTPVATGIKANATGSWNANFTVPASAAGQHAIRTNTAASNVPDQVFTVTPAFSATLSAGSPGTSITVNGAGFGANEGGIAVVFDNSNVASGIRASATGSWSATFLVPPSPAGQHIIHAYGLNTPLASTPDVSFSVTGGITLSPASSVPGNPLTVAGAGFASGETGIAVTYDGNVIASGIRANQLGSWSVTFTIPSSTSGPHTLHANGAQTVASTTQDATLTVSPGISISQASGVPGFSLAVTGAGFGASEPGITITYDSTTVGSGIRADALGSWNASFFVPPSVGGPHTIRAFSQNTQASSLTEVVFTVTPTVASSQSSGYIGMEVRLSGSGFAANSPLKLTYDGVDIPAEGGTDSSGSFSISIVIPKSKAGAHTIRVTDGQRGEARSSFNISNTPPPIPTPIFPEDGARIGILGDVTPTFRWSSVSDPNSVTYVFQIDTYLDFAQPVLQKTGITGNRYSLSAGEALPRGDYFWRVKAVNGASVESDWSDIRMFNSGLLPLWALVLAIVFALAVAGVAVYMFWGRPRAAKRRELMALPEGQTLPAPQWRMLESGAPPIEGRRQLPWRLALPEAPKGTAPLAAEDQARFIVILDFAKSLPLLDPGYDAAWLVDLYETETGSKATPEFYEQLLKGDVQVQYDPAWLRHPVYQELTVLLEGQPVLLDLNTFVEAVNGLAGEALSLLQAIYANTLAESDPDIMERGGWGFISAVYSDAVHWYRGKNLNDPSERDYSTERQVEGETTTLWLCGGAATAFAGRFVKVPDEAAVPSTISLHLKLRRAYRSNDQARRLATGIARVEVQRTRLVSVFSQLGSLRQEERPH